MAAGMPVAIRYLSSLRMRYMWPNLPPELVLLTAAAMLQSSNVSAFTLRMVGCSPTRVRGKPSRMAFTDNALCEAGLVVAIVLKLNFS